MATTKAFLSRHGYLPYLAWALVAFLIAFPVIHLDLQGDEGFFAIQTMRVLNSQLPNLDFICPYIGGLLFYHAFWFKILGPSLLALRIDLLFLFILFIPTVYYVARLMMTTRWAVIATLSVLFGTLPFYPFSGANWYATFLSFLAFAVMAKPLIEEADIGKKTLLLSGVLLGCSFLIKQTTGLYTGFAFFLALLLRLIWITDKAASSSKNFQYSLGNFYGWFGLISIGAYLFWILKHHLSFPIFLLYFLPFIALAYFIAKKIMTQRPDLSPLPNQLHILMSGLLAPFLIYLMPYIARGQAIPFLHEAFIAGPTSLLSLFYQDYLSSLHQLALLISVLITSGLLLLPKIRWLGCLLFLAGLLICLGTAQDYSDLATAGLYLYALLPLWIVLTGFTILLTRNQATPNHNERLFAYTYLLGFFLFLCTYPVFALPYVATNVAPLLLVLTFSLSHLFERLPKRYGWACYLIPVWLVVFGLATLYRYQGQPLGSYLQNPFPNLQSKLDAPYGHVSIASESAKQIQDSAKFVQQHSLRSNDVYLLSNRLAELYFLTGHQNPTPYDYHFHSIRSDGNDIIEALEKNRVRYLFVDTENKPLIPFQEKLKRYIETHYRVETQIQPFVILSRNREKQN